jgi:hypothetical protein
MKFHWGHGIVFSFISFSCFIGYYAIKIQTAPELEHQLVVENYFAEELKTEALLKALQNGKPWRDSIQIRIDDNQILCSKLPRDQSIRLGGYRASNPQADFNLTFFSPKGSFTVDKKQLLKGKWKFTFEWEKDAQRYRVDKEIHLN